MIPKLHELRRIEMSNYWMSESENGSMDGEILEQTKKSKCRVIHEASLISENEKLFDFY